MYNRKQANSNINNLQPIKARSNKISQKVIIDKKNESNSNQFKFKDEQLLIFVREYLLSLGYNRTCETLKRQKPIRKVSTHRNTSSSSEVDNKTLLLQLFERGSRQEFFKQTTKVFATPTEQLRKLEFELNIYFCIYGVHPSIRKATKIDQSSMEAFRKYLDQKGSQLANTSQFLSFFALPYIPKPQEHQGISYVFTKEWINKLKNKLTELLTHQSKQSTISDKKLTVLQQIYHNSFNNEHKQQECKQNCKHFLQLQEVKNYTKQLETYIELVQNHFKQFTQSSKVNLIQSNRKWFNFSKQLLIIAKKASRGEKVPQLQKYQGFFGKNIDDLIYGNNDISLFERNSYAQDNSVTPSNYKNANISRNKPQKSVIAYQIDTKKIIGIFLQSNDKTRQTQICLVLRALKNRFSRLKNLYARREIIIEYSRHDICGIKPCNYTLQHKLLFEGTEATKQFFLRLINHISIDFCGIKYLIQSQKLIQNLVSIFSTDSQYGASRKYVLGILQRFSFFKKTRLLMIDQQIIEIIFRIFGQEKEQLEDFAIQYLAGLIMNLSMQKNSRIHFEKQKGDLMAMLEFLIENDNNEIKNYVNGTIYLLLTSQIIRNEAIKSQLDYKIKSIMEKQNNEDQMYTNQYKYILMRFEEENVQSENHEEQDSSLEEEAEAEQFDDQGSIESQSSSQYLEGQSEYLSGEQLLIKQYALLGPQAVREHMLTRSLLDQNSRRINNLTTSINRSKRIDNIFSQKPIMPLLEPELDKLLHPLR